VISLISFPLLSDIEKKSPSRFELENALVVFTKHPPLFFFVLAQFVKQDEDLAIGVRDLYCSCRRIH